MGKTFIHKTLHIFMRIMIAFAFMMILLFSFFIYIEYSLSTKWMQKTSPLNSYTIEDLCIRLDIEKEKICQDDYPKPVYAPNFFPYIREIIQPKNGEWATFEEVEELIGEYKVEQTDPNFEKGVNYYRVLYDLKGDGVTWIFVIFYPTGIMESANYSRGDY